MNMMLILLSRPSLLKDKDTFTGSVGFPALPPTQSRRIQMFILFRPFANFKKLLSFYVCFLQKKGNILMESDNTGSVCDECEQDIRTEIAKIRTVQNELSRKTDRLLINHEEMQKRLSQVEEKMEDTSCVVDELYGFIDDMDDSIEKLKSEQEELCTCTDDLESEYKDLDDSLQSAHQRIDDLKQDSSFSIECVQRLYTSLSGSLSNASEEITHSSHPISACQPI